MRQSKYWDDFSRRIDETVIALKSNKTPIIRRVACFITDRCNFRCAYCNSNHKGNIMSKNTFIDILKKYGDTAIIHITGGEPSTVSWLYPLLEDIGDKYRIHLNTNMYINPPSTKVKRLKVSLDSHDYKKWDKMIGVSGAWNTVVSNLKKHHSDTITSITYTLSRQTYMDVIDFAKFCNKEFPNLYAIFFSVYKGDNPEFKLTKTDIDEFFNIIMPKLLIVLNDESKALIEETIDEKRRLMEGIRFQQNIDKNQICYLSMSERVISPLGIESTCSHLYRDGIYPIKPFKYKQCEYGCNRRLVMFNENVERLLKS